MRGLCDSYNIVMKDINKFCSKEEVIKRAKKKLLGVKYDDMEYFECNVSTQKGVVLVGVGFTDSNNYKFYMQIPRINLNSWDTTIGVGTYTTKLMTYDNLCSVFNSHKSYCCSSNELKRLGDLGIHFYFHNFDYYLTGIVNNEIVFMFKLISNYDISISSIKLCNDYIEILINSYVFILNLYDYSIERLSYERYKESL